MARPSGPDVSLYQDDPSTITGIDFAKLKSVSDFVILRAGQNVWRDSAFNRGWLNARRVGLRRGSYWFFDSRVKPKDQADLWVDILDGDFGELPMFCDFEEEYGGPYRGWDHFQEFMEWLKVIAHGHELAIYTAYYYWKDNVPAERLEYFHQYPLWIASYRDDAPLVPAPWSPSEWLFWQYTENGPGGVYGVESSRIDLNYYNGDRAAFDQRYPPITVEEPEMPDEIHVSTHDGVTYHKIRRFNTDCHVHVIDLDKVTMKLTRPFATIPGAVSREGAQLGFNGGGWGLWSDKSLPNEYLIIEGQVFQTKSFDGRPCIEVTRDNSVIFHTSQPSFSKSWNVFGFDRIIASHGVFNPRITDNSSAPRTVYGTPGANVLVVLVCEGRAVNQKGLTFKETWEVMKEFGVTDCGNADGGYSSAAVNTAFSPALLNPTYQVESRRTVHQVLFFADGETPAPPPEGDDSMYKFTAPVSRSLRSGHSVYDGTIGTVPANEVVLGNELWVAPADGPNVKKYDQWLRVTKVGATATAGWIAVSHMGQPQGTLTEISDTPDPEPTPEFPPELWISLTETGERRKYVPG